MEEKINLKLIDVSGRNITLLISFDGFVGRFWFSYQDETRKNSAQPDWSVINVYYEPTQPEDGHFSGSYNIDSAFDAMLLVMRHQQWILEEAMRQFGLR